MNPNPEFRSPEASTSLAVLSDLPGLITAGTEHGQTVLQGLEKAGVAWELVTSSQATRAGRSGSQGSPPSAASGLDLIIGD